MKARIKNTGEIIKVERLTNTTYGRLDVAQIYRKDMLDFDLPEPKEGVTIEGWVARDDGERWHERELHLFIRNKPERRKLMGDWIGRSSMTLDSNLFPSLTWDDDPIEVEITIKPKKQSSTK